MLSVAKTLVSQRLPEGPLVVYSPEGKARPLVLTDKALQVFEHIRDRPLSKQELIDETKGFITVGDLDRIIHCFIDESILTRISKAGFQIVNPSKRKRISFWIHLTDKCNLRCPYCYVKKGNTKMTEETFSLALNAIIKYCVNHETKEVIFKFAGGEPLTSFDLLKQLVSLAKERFHGLDVRLTFSIITNGTLISQEKAEYLNRNKFFVAVSLDGINEFNSTRMYPSGGNSFEQTMNGINRLVHSGINPAILTVISNQNIEGAQHLFEFCSRNNLRLSMSLSRQIGNQATSLDTTKFIEAFIPRFRDFVMKQNPVPNFSFANINFDRPRNKPCAAGISFFAIDCFGRISSCQMTIGIRELSNAAIDGTDAIAFAKLAYLPRNKPTVCENCTWKHACAGGCEVMAEISGTKNNPSLHCRGIQKLLPILLILEGRKIIKKGGIQYESG